MAATRAFGAQISGNALASPSCEGGAVKPQVPMTQAKLEAALEKIVEQNNNKLGEWEIRAKGLEALQQLVADGCCDSSHFMPLFTAMLQKAVLDMTTRSASSKPALVKVGCSTVRCLAAALENKLAKHGELYVRALLNNIRDGQTHGVIEDSQECMATLLSHVHASKMIVPLASACDAKVEKSPVCRTASIEHLNFIVQHWPAAVVKKQLSTIVDCIRRTQADSSPGARTAARQCFWHLHARWESAANKLLATLEPSAVKQLNSVRKTMGKIEVMHEGSCAEETEQQRPHESPRKTEQAAAVSRVGEGHQRRTPGLLGEAQRTARKRPQTGASAAKSSKSTHAEHTKAAATVGGTGSTGQHPSESVETALLNAMSKCADGSASVRLESFHELQQLCSSLEAQTARKLFDKLVTLLAEHTADGNEKVAAGCLTALTAYVQSYGELFTESHLSNLLPSVLLKTVAKDRATKAAVHAALEKIQAHCGAEALLSSTLKTFGHKNQNIQGACLDLTISLLTSKHQEACAAYVGAAKHMKLFLEKVLPYIKHKKPDFRRAGAQCLHGLYNVAPEAFNARMRRRTAEDQRDVTGVLMPLVPGFSIGGSADTLSPRKTTRKAPIPVRGSPEAAATVIQSVARGRRGRKLSKEMQRQNQDDKPCQCEETPALTTRIGTSASAASEDKTGQHGTTRNTRQLEKPPAEETRRQKQKPAVPRQKPTPMTRKLKAEATPTVKPKSEPTSSTTKQQQQPQQQRQEEKEEAEQVMDTAASQHPLFEHKPPPDTKRLEQLEEKVATLRRTGSASFTPSSGPEEGEHVGIGAEMVPAVAEAITTNRLSMQSCAEGISRRVNDEDTTELLQHLRQLCDLVTQSATDELEQSLSDVFAPLRNCMDHSAVEVRKVVVLCCVNMYLQLGSKMNDELAQLTDVQRRLVQLYVNRIYTKRKEAEEGTARS